MNTSQNLSHGSRTRQLRSFTQSLSVRGALWGALWSAMLFVAVHHYWLTVGTASHELVAVLMTGLGGLALGFRSNSFAQWSGSAWRSRGTVVLGALCVASGWTAGATISLLKSLPPDVLMAAPWLIPLAVSLVCVLPAGWLIGRLLQTFTAETSLDSQKHGLLAAACGAWLALTGLSLFGLPTLGLFGVSIGACAVAIIVAALSLVTRSATATHLSENPAVTADDRNRATEPAGFVRLAAWCGVFVTGALAVVACAALRELIPPAFYLTVTAVAAVMLGAAIGQHVCKPGRSLQRLAAWWIAGLIWSLIWLASFPELTNRLLQANAHVSHVGLLMAIRWFTFTACLMPLGAAWGGISASVSSVSSVSDRHGAGLMSRAAAWQTAPAFLFGCCVCILLLSVGCTVPMVAQGIGFATVAAVLVMFYRDQSAFSSRAKLVLLLAVVFVCFAPWALSGYSPQTAARLLFATTVFQADLDGEDRELLQYMDGGRLLETAPGEFGTLTVWRFRGAQIQIREGGVPRAIASGDPRICPDYSAEIVPTVMGLLLHEDPHEVLLLGAGAGAPSQAALTFPTRAVHCAESDADLLNAVRRHVWADGLANPEQDERFHVHELNPLAAVLALPQTFDVIVSAPSHPSLSQSQPWLTREFYQRVGEKLSAEGVFVQRFQQLDFDARPLRALVAAFQDVFAQTCAVEIAPGEIAVFGTNGSDFLRPGLVKRMRRPHVQIVLSRLGWDWSMLLDLPAYDHETLTRLLDEAGDEAETPVRINGVRNGCFAYWLPREMMRWGEKSREQQTQLQAYRSRIAYWLPPDHKELPEIRQRFAELRTQRHLMTDYPDEPWMYRKKLKDHLQTGLRPAIQQVSASKAEMHPIDRRRKAYVMALADAVRTRSKHDIAELASFEFPHDPLLSFFVHQEVAELYARSEERDPRLELMHRLHDIHFADPRDRSVRNVAAAIELLVSEPEVVESDWDRWDHLNALLQVLKYRWDARSAVPPSSPQIALNDVEESVSAMNQAFETMEGLTSTLGIGAEHWQRRRRYLERNLQRPLRTYRTKLIPHQQSELKKQLQADTGDEDDQGEPETAPLAN